MLVGTNAVVAAYAVSSRELVIMVIEGLSPVRRFFPFQEGCERRSLHVPGDLDAAQVQSGFGIIEVLHQVVVLAPGLDDVGPTHEQWRTEGFLVHPALVVPTMLAKIPTLVG